MRDTQRAQKGQHAAMPLVGVSRERRASMRKSLKLVLVAALLVAGVGAGLLAMGGSSGSALPLGAPGVDVAAFKTGALTEAITEESCTLTDGTKTTCYRITVTGTPIDTVIGPFCPETTSTSAADSGIWLDGSNIYDADGKFILDLSTIYGDAQWRLYDESGKVNVTDSKESFQGAARPDVLDAYKYHCVEGRFEWTNSGAAVPISILVPVTPVKASAPVSTQGADLGVTINGLVIAPSAPVQAILKAYTIAAFDDCGGHFNPIEGYHLHAFTDCKGTAYDASIDDSNAETRLIGYALGGVAVFAPLAHDTTIQLDECNGRTTEKDGYHYYAQAPELNQVVKCYMGLLAVDPTHPQQGPPGGGPGGGGPGGLLVPGLAASAGLIGMLFVAPKLRRKLR
jgi:hypothetical protein